MADASPITILGICGSLRRRSFNRAALEAARELVPAGATLDVLDLHGIPLFCEDDEKQPPAAVVELKHRVRAADALLFATPEYNYSVPGVLKNAIDWGSRPYSDNAWAGKPAAIMGASPGALGTARAQYHLRQTFVFLDVRVLNRPEVMIGQASTRFDAEGRLTDADTREHVRKLVAALVDWTRLLAR